RCAAVGGAQIDPDDRCRLAHGCTAILAHPPAQSRGPIAVGWEWVRAGTRLPAEGPWPRGAPLGARHYLKSVRSQVKQPFAPNPMILSFEEWFDLFLRDPAQQARTSAQYVRDCMDHFGTTTLQTPVGPQRRFNLFDMPFDAGVGRVAGQEEAQNDVY